MKQSFKIFKIFFLTILLFSKSILFFQTCYAIPDQQIEKTIQQVSSPQELIKDMQRYKTTNQGQAGDLFEHSIWVALALNKWFDEGYHWCQDIDLGENDKRILILTGFLHDIGKAGDNEIEYLMKPEHPKIGFKYILGKKNYKIGEDKVFNFDKFFDDLKVSHDDRKLIAIFVGSHHEFGQTIDDGLKKGEDKYGLYENYLNYLQELAQKAKYNNGEIDEKLIKLSILVSMADIKGIQQVSYSSKILEGLIGIDGKDIHAPRVGVDCYTRFKCESGGVIRKQDILQLFQARKTSNVGDDLFPSNLQLQPC